MQAFFDKITSEDQSKKKTYTQWMMTLLAQTKRSLSQLKPIEANSKAR